MDLIIFIVALSVLVLVHEWGHFIAARKTGVRVEEFGLGLPPRIVGKKIGQTIYSLNWLPIGGFCKLYGEDFMEEQKKEDEKKKTESFQYKKPWQKLLIVLGGVLMNLVLAIVIFSVVYTVLGVPVETDKVSVVAVSENSPAEKIGLQEKDVILSVNGKEITKGSELIEEVAKFRGKEVVLEVIKKGEVEKSFFDIEVRENPPEGEGSMGVAISNTELIKAPWYRVDKGIVAGFKEAYYWGEVIFGGVFKMIGGLLMGQVPKDVSGPIGMYEATSAIKENQGILAVIHFFGIVSVNLAVVNVLPFPALDGGRIIFVIYEMITKKRANQKIEATVNNIGMLLLLGLILLITVGDIGRLIGR